MVGNGFGNEGIQIFAHFNNLSIICAVTKKILLFGVIAEELNFIKYCGRNKKN
jgi:hypothetical protein